MSKDKKESEDKMSTDTNEKEVDELIAMIDEKMNSGVSRLSVGFSEDLFTGVKKETYHHGRCDVGSPWAKGIVSNCDATDTNE